MLRGHENPDNLGEILHELARDFDVTIRPAQTASVGKVGPDLGGPKFVLLQAPRVALAADRMSNAFGSGVASVGLSPQDARFARRQAEMTCASTTYWFFLRAAPFRRTLRNGWLKAERSSPSAVRRTRSLGGNEDLLGENAARRLG